MFSWLAQEAELSNAALTVRAQAINPLDTGRLVWPTFFPPVDVDSTRLEEISTVDFRPASDRREWNTRGRQIHFKTPDTRALEMIPIESWFKIDEYEIQKLEERTLGNEALFRALVGPTIPARTDRLVDANFRRIEVDALRQWALGTILVRNPQGLAADQTVSLEYDTSRYVTAVTAWDDGSVNAYDLFLSAIEAATEKMGVAPEGAMTRLNVFKAIQADAPRPVNAANIQLTRRELLDRIEADTGRPFTFFINEESVDVYDDGGLSVTRTKLWAASRLAFIPPGNVVGQTSFAPVARAFEIARQAPQAGINIRGQTVYTEVAGNGRDLTVECQVNALSTSNEQTLYVVNTQVA